MRVAALFVVVLALVAVFAATASAVCTDYKDQATCLASSENGVSCAWCVSKAVPSLCCNQQQAKRLPGGVFQCSWNQNEEVFAAGNTDN